MTRVRWRYSIEGGQERGMIVETTPLMTRGDAARFIAAQMERDLREQPALGAERPIPQWTPGTWEDPPRLADIDQAARQLERNARETLYERMTAAVDQLTRPEAGFSSRVEGSWRPAPRTTHSTW